MYLDPRDHRTIRLVDTLQAAADDLAELILIEKLKPAFSKDGDMFCFCLGEMPVHCVVGFGETPAKAMREFYRNFYQESGQ